MPPLVVEGITDAVFFCGLLRRHLSEVRVNFMDQPGKRRIPASVTGLQADGSLLEFDFRNQDPETGGGRDRIPEAVRALIRDIGVLHLAVAKDLDGNTPDIVVRSIRDVVLNLLGGPIENVSEEKFRIQNVRLANIPKGQWVTVAVIPMGLYDDPDLKALGITRHAMEDYLIKMLLLDESLRPGLPQFRQLLLDLLNVIRGESYKVSIDSSKELFQLVKPVVKVAGNRFNDTGVINALFDKANSAILESVVAPVRGQLQQAVAL